MASETRTRIAQVIDQLDADSQANRVLRTQAAIVMIMTSPEYIVLR